MSEEKFTCVRPHPSLFMRALLTAVFISLLSNIAMTQDALPPERSPHDAVATFLPRVEALTAELGIMIEHSELRLNRCSHPDGERDDVFYVWAGLRGATVGGDAGSILEALHAEWQEAGWTITRYRYLDNGGVNIAATEPSTGNAFSLDSGFAADPDRYIVGTLNTPCFHAGTDVSFGEIHDVAL